MYLTNAKVHLWVKLILKMVQKKKIFCLRKKKATKFNKKPAYNLSEA